MSRRPTTPASWLTLAAMLGAVPPRQVAAQPSRAEATVASVRPDAEPAMGELFDLSIQELMNVSVVTATKTALPLVEAPAIMAVITASQIRTRGYRSVGQALEAVAGLDPLTDHVQYNLGVRGVSGGQAAWSRIFKVMIDGQAVSLRSTSQNLLGEELVPIGLVERIEVVRGPASALYGADAFLGVINVITRRAESIDGFEVGGHVGEVVGHPAYGTEVAVGRQSGPVSFLGGAAWSRTDRSGLSPVNVPGNTSYGPGDLSRVDVSTPASAFARLTVRTPAPWTSTSPCSTCRPAASSRTGPR
jgi:outer membrane receptor for ferrienterochelin and colicins